MPNSLQISVPVQVELNVIPGESSNNIENGEPKYIEPVTALNIPKAGLKLLAANCVDKPPTVHDPLFKTFKTRLPEVKLPVVDPLVPIPDTSPYSATMTALGPTLAQLIVIVLLPAFLAWPAQSIV